MILVGHRLYSFELTSCMKGTMKIDARSQSEEHEDLKCENHQNKLQGMLQEDLH